MKAIELYKKWNKDIEKRCEEILQSTPESETDYRTWSPLPTRRSEAVNIP